MTRVRDTSLDAYHDPVNREKLGRCQVIVLECLEKYPDSTDREISWKTGLAINNVTGRRNELVDLGLVEENGKRVCSISGRTVYQWRIK